MIEAVTLLIHSIIVLGAFLGGLALGVNLHSKQSTHALNEATEQKKPIKEADEDTQKELLKQKLALRNFYSYDGTVQEKPEELVHTLKG